MNNEIKEIISDLQRVADRKCYPEDILCGSIAQEWIDYITDLQQENERLKEELLSKPDNEITLKTTDGQTMTIIQSERIDMQEKLNKSLEEMYKKYNDYKSRNEKAIEYLKKCGSMGMLEQKYAYVNIPKVLDTLQELKGDSSNE